MTGYNGWSNRETWVVALWCSDQWECKEDVDATESWLSEELESINGPLRDMIDFHIIDWDELRNSVEEDEG